MFSASAILSLIGLYTYHHTTYFVLDTFFVCCTIWSTAYWWWGLPLSCTLCSCSSRLSLFGSLDGRTCLVDGLFGKAGASTTGAAVKVFSMPSLTMETTSGRNLTMQNGLVLYGKSMWYAPSVYTLINHHWLQPVVVEEGIFICPYGSLSFGIHGGHNLVYNAVATFLQDRPNSLAKRRYRFQISSEDLH